MADAVVLQARLDALEAALTAALTGERVLKVAYDGGSVEYDRPASTEDLRRAIWEAKMLLNRALGNRSGGVIVPVFVG